MAHVANVMLSVYTGDTAPAADFSRWLEWECPRADPRDTNLGCGSLNLLTGPDTQWGGRKYPECNVFAGTLNGADLGAVVARFAGTGWRFPAQAQLLVMDQDESMFRLWMITDGEARQYAPIRDLSLGDYTP